MDKNIFDMVEPAYEPLSEQDELKILAAVTAKTGGADAMDRTTGVGVTTGGAGMADGSGADEAYTALNGDDLERRKKTASGRAGFGKSTTPGTRGRGRHGRRIAVIAIAAVLAFGAVAFASTAIDPDSPLLALFNLDGKQLGEQEAQLIQSSGTFIGKTVEKNGVKIHVKEAIGDKDTVYLLVDVTPPKDATEPGTEYNFERVELKEAFPSLSGSGSAGWSSSSSELSEDGTFPLIISATVDNGVQGKKLTLELHDLQRALKTDLDEDSISDGESAVDANSEADAMSAADTSYSLSAEDSGLIETFGVEKGDNGEIIEYKMTTDEDGNIIDYVSGSAVDGNVDGNVDSNMTFGDNPFKTVVEGDWQVTFTLDYADNSTYLNINEDIDIDGDSYRLSDVRISPLSLSYTIDSGKAVNIDSNMDIYDKLGELTVIIKMNDGAEYNITEYPMGGSGMSDGTMFTMNTQFQRIIDPKQVESITFGNHEVKL